MRLSTKARMNRMFTNGGCLDVAIDHGVCNEPSFMVGLEDMAVVMDTLIKAKPDAIQCAYGQADFHLPCLSDRQHRRFRATDIRKQGHSIAVIDNIGRLFRG